MAKKKSTAGKAKSGSRSRKPPAENVSGAPFNEQDPKRRLGNFSGAGEHARQGGRSTGIVGQTKKRNRTDKSKSAKK
jgi:hypothetical protein